jgi:hypothetical protein
MRLRNSVENVVKLKEEIEQLKYIRNPYNVTMSFSNMESKIN